MCTVTYLPLPGGGYLLGTNRDERHHRGRAAPPSLRVLGGRKVLAPTDADAGGTWVALDERGHCLCLLNGDRAPAAAPPPAPRSRGLLVLELLIDPGVDAVTETLQALQAAGELSYRSFKLLSVERDPVTRARLLEWNGVALSVEDLDSVSLVVSSTYETDAVTAQRSRWFAELVHSTDTTDVDSCARDLLAWHAGHGPGADLGDAYSVCMHRDDAHTVSQTLVQVSGERLGMDYRPGQPCHAAPVERHDLPVLSSGT